MYTFENTTLIPQYSEIESRTIPCLKTHLTKHIELDHPIIPTNMSTITELDMMKLLDDFGGIAFMHRFMSYDDIYDKVIRASKDLNIGKVCFSVGVGNKDKKLIKDIARSNSNYIPNVVLIDIAHGDSKLCVDMISFIKKQLPHIEVIAGNVATENGYLRLVEAGADAVRVGIAGGSVCTTKDVTGHYLPLLESVRRCFKAKKECGLDIPIIADGGFRSSGDMSKALAFGADSVCCGRLFAGSSATPGDLFEVDGKPFKDYYGMSSETAQNRHKDGLKHNIAPEGNHHLITYAGETDKILQTLIAGVKSGLTYSGALNLEEFRKKVFIEKIT